MNLTMPEAVSQQVSVHRSVVRLIRGAITDLDVEAFVFYAQHNLALGSGFGTAISVRGGPKIQEELHELGPLQTGDAIVTGAGKLKANWIVHSVGPRFNEPDTEDKLRTTVLNTLKAAQEKGIRQIALPPMGTGFYMVPLDLCARVMIDTIAGYLKGETAIEDVVICVMDSREFAPFQSQLASLNT